VGGVFLCWPDVFSALGPSRPKNSASVKK